jgi:hypothetical protein
LRKKTSRLIVELTYRKTNRQKDVAQQTHIHLCLRPVRRMVLTSSRSTLIEIRCARQALFARWRCNRRFSTTRCTANASDSISCRVEPVASRSVYRHPGLCCLPDALAATGRQVSTQPNFGRWHKLAG